MLFRSIQNSEFRTTLPYQPQRRTTERRRPVRRNRPRLRLDAPSRTTYRPHASPSLDARTARTGSAKIPPEAPSHQHGVATSPSGLDSFVRFVRFVVQRVLAPPPKSKTPGLSAGRFAGTFRPEPDQAALVSDLVRMATAASRSMRSMAATSRAMRSRDRKSTRLNSSH